MSEEFKPIGEFTLHDVKIQVLSEEDCEKVDMVLCVRIGGLHPGCPINPHNIPSKCSRCGHDVYRDGRGPKKPPSLCIECAMANDREESHTE